MANDIISALSAIPVSSLSYQQWINVGFALKESGYSCDIWEDWSRNDSRFEEGLCRRKWDSFNGTKNPITVATIFQMARDNGWKGFEGDGILDWEDYIEFDGDTEKPSVFNPVSELKTYLSILFQKDDFVGYVVSSLESKDGKFYPANAGCYDRTAGQLISLLEKHSDDLGAVIGDWNPKAGAWIRFNALDGKGIKNDNVISYKYALVESDSMSLYEQNKVYKALNLPIAILVSSAGKSLHAIVHIDAKDYEQYRERVDFLYSFLKERGLEIDTQNRNPSRLSRMPGVTRGDSVQKIEGVNIGPSSWDEWKAWIDSDSDNLPPVVSLAEFKDNPPILPDELIYSVLRSGHKMIISGPSKAGKSFLLMELCVSFAEGVPWLGFDVKKGKVLYVNLEIDQASCITRFLRIYEALGLKGESMDNISIWNLRGNAVPLDQLVPKIVKKMQGKGYEAVIIDPIYKVITGDENSASDMGAFCNQFDKICNEVGCSAIYCHHHSKGSQGSKKAMDRSSGSGVFGRDPDAILDVIELELTDDIKNFVRDGNATAWRLEGSLREFPPFKPINFWFEYPVHRLDNKNLETAPSEGSPEANLSKSSKRTSKDQRLFGLISAFDCTCENGVVELTAMATYLGVDEKTVRRHIKEFEDEFECKNGIVIRKNKN